MNEEAIRFYARKFFGHLPERYGVLCVLAALNGQIRLAPDATN